VPIGLESAALAAVEATVDGVALGAGADAYGTCAGAAPGGGDDPPHAHTANAAVTAIRRMTASSLPRNGDRG
jgi:hypothetical protein